MELLCFLVSFLSSTIGAISGIGGGVIIKPVLDSLQIMAVSEINFLSGCTVLCMSTVSLLRSRGGKVQINKLTSTWLAVGACIGGIAGKSIFSWLIALVPNGNYVGAIQSVILLLINVGVLLYMKNKNRIVTMNVTGIPSCIIIGLFLGLSSSFLGIGGGPINIAVLYYFFSMQPKETALNSLYIIFFSQITSLGSTLLTGSLPKVGGITLAVMCLGGVGGAFLGRYICSRIDEKRVEQIFNILLTVLICINIYNIVMFLG